MLWINLFGVSIICRRAPSQSPAAFFFSFRKDEKYSVCTKSFAGVMMKFIFTSSYKVHFSVCTRYGIWNVFCVPRGCEVWKNNMLKYFIVNIWVVFISKKNFLIHVIYEWCGWRGCSLRVADPGHGQRFLRHDVIQRGLPVEEESKWRVSQRFASRRPIGEHCRHVPANQVQGKEISPNSFLTPARRTALLVHYLWSNINVVGPFFFPPILFQENAIFLCNFI